MQKNLRLWKFPTRHSPFRKKSPPKNRKPQSLWKIPKLQNLRSLSL